MAGSWEGLPPEAMIANWNGGKREASLKFFADIGHTQLIAGYYDHDDLSDIKKWVEAAKGKPGVTGFMYTTWEHKFGMLEAYGKALSGRE
jgi:hypothetical protein